MTTKPTSATPKERFNALREGWDEHTSDGEMYSGLRNLFLEVVDELEQMRKERDGLREYAVHREECSFGPSFVDYSPAGWRPCTCGLEELLK